MYKVTNIFNEERGFETDGKVFVLKPKDSVIVKNPPEETEGIFKIEKATDVKALKEPEETKINEVKK